MFPLLRYQAPRCNFHLRYQASSNKGLWLVNLLSNILNNLFLDNIHTNHLTINLTLKDLSSVNLLSNILNSLFLGNIHNNNLAINLTLKDLPLDLLLDHIISLAR